MNRYIVEILPPQKDMFTPVCTYSKSEFVNCFKPASFRIIGIDFVEMHSCAEDLAAAIWQFDYEQTNGIDKS